MTEPPRAIFAPAKSFAGQLRHAADDPKTAAGTMREAMRDAASVIEAHMQLIALQQAWINQLRLQVGAGVALSLTALALAAVAIWFAV